ncbi:metallo-dependent hydrolase [Synergistales bacterium]|nr:metallo-dependent hydrolase [Synergistales bacterium]
MTIDILIRNGHVIDPSRDIDDIQDVGIDKGVIVDVSGEKLEAVQIVDAEGCYVFPGLIDFHTHLYYNSASRLGGHPNFMLSTGVTSLVDAGTAGCENYKHFHDTVVSASEEHIKAQISCYPTGMANGHENFDPALFKKKETAARFQEYPNEIIGLKIRLSYGLAEGIESLVAAIRMSEDIGGAPICVHVTNSPCAMGNIADLLRRGDIFCHVYHGTGNTILDENNKVYKKIRQARERGVIFDAGGGKMNGSHHVTKESLARDFPPDVISTDMTGDKLHYSSRSRNLPFVMSRFLSMGMSLRDVLRCVTETPAKLMNEEGRLGTLRPGAVGDVTVMTLAEQDVHHYDSNAADYISKQLLIPQLSVLRGEIAFCQPTFNLTQYDFGI